MFGWVRGDNHGGVGTLQCLPGNVRGYHGRERCG